MIMILVIIRNRYKENRKIINMDKKSKIICIIKVR